MPNRIKKLARTRGTAMTETLLVLPILMIIAAMLVFFGRGMARLHRSEGMARYEAWRAVAGVDVLIRGADENGNRHGIGPFPYSEHIENPFIDINPLLNQTFFGDNAETITRGGGNLYGGEAIDTLVNYADVLSPDSGDLIEEISRDNPIAVGVETKTAHDEPVNFFRSFGETPMLDRLVHHGHHWRFAAGWRVTHVGRDWIMPDDYQWQPTRTGASGTSSAALSDLFLSHDLDDALAAQGDNALAQMIRGLYRHEAGYVGPHVY